VEDVSEVESLKKTIEDTKPDDLSQVARSKIRSLPLSYVIRTHLYYQQYIMRMDHK